jgi:hypothetical protein
MEENKPKSPMRETTKDDSSDVEKVKQNEPAPPPRPKTGQDKTKEEEEAEKGHS